MANSTPQIDLVVANQSSKEDSSNVLFNACSCIATLGRRASTTTGLTWGYYGGNVLIASVLSQKANGTVSLTANSTNYIEFNLTSGAVEVNTTGWNVDTKAKMYKVVTGTTSVTSYEDWRDFGFVIKSGKKNNYSEGLPGAANTAYGIGSAVIGAGNSIPNDLFYSKGWGFGISNTLQGSSTGGSVRYSFAIGSGNYALSKEQTYVFGHENNVGETTGGNYSQSIGFEMSTYGTYAQGFGRRGNPFRNAGFHLAHGMLVYKGDTQSMKFTSRIQTTNATATDMSTTEASYVEIKSNSSATFSGVIVARSTSGSLNAAWKIEGAYKSIVGGNSFIGTPTITPISRDAGASAWSISLSVASGFKITVTGAAGTTIRWVANFEIAEVFYN